jgi:RNA polymerase sigma factor (sigma-70 family)
VPQSSSDPASVDQHANDTRARVLLRMLHDARRRGDREAAERAWQQIVLAELERVRGIVRCFRDPSLPDGRIAESDIDDVVQHVFLRLHERVDGLRGESVGELRSFMRTAANYACLDHLRRVITDDQRRAGSLDAAAQEPSAVSRAALDRVVAELAVDNEETEAARAMVHRALAEVDFDKRAVLVMDQAGYPIEEIQERLELSRDAVYQRRRRGLKQLREAILEMVQEDAEA